MVQPADAPATRDASSRQDLRQRASAVRDRREWVVSAVAGEEMSFLEVCRLACRDGDVGHIKIVTLLQAVPGVGKVRARRALAEVGVGETRPLGSVSPAELDALLRVLDG